MAEQTKHELDTGLDVLVLEGFARLKGSRVAILANQASVDKHLNHIVKLALKYQLNIVKLFAPEHGFSGVLQDMEHVGEGLDYLSKLKVISLYGDHKDSLKLKAKHLEDVDILLCDLQDIGSRYYTFHCTIAWALAACQESQTHLMVIDRPNPINAHNIEGNLVKRANFSFVGAYPILNRHGFTMGELVNYVAAVLDIKFKFEVIWMRNYQRQLFFDALALPWVPPSPNMPTLNTAIVYPGMCLIEGTNLSEGRGTCTPFELVGAPYIHDAEEFKSLIDQEGGEGFTTRACSFRPKFHKYAEQNCNGVFIHVNNAHSFRPLRLALAVIKAAMNYPQFDWRTEAYEFETERLAIDLLLGDQQLRTMLEAKAPLREIFAIFEQAEHEFSKLRSSYLRY